MKTSNIVHKQINRIHLQLKMLLKTLESDLALIPKIE